MIKLDPFSEELLEQARHLLARPGQSKQADLRRAVSAAYYALFHQFTADTTFTHTSARPKGLREISRRAIGHSEIKRACMAFIAVGKGVKSENAFAELLTNID